MAVQLTSEDLPRVLAMFDRRGDMHAKIIESVEMIRKAERFALKYEGERGFHLAFSGGKDSQCLYHVAQLAGVAFHAVFSPTTVDPPEVIRFIRTEYPSVEFVKPRRSIYDAFRSFHVMPTRRARWCCSEFKENKGKVVLTGVRNAESAKRAERMEVEVSGRKFKGDLTLFDQYRERKGVEGGCLNGKDQLIINPIIKWTEREVWLFLNTVGEPHCVLYDQGFKRVGCIACPMATRRKREEDFRRWPIVREKWRKALEDVIGAGFLTDSGLTAEEHLEWWFSGLSLKRFAAQKKAQLTLDFGGDAKDKDKDKKV